MNFLVVSLFPRIVVQCAVLCCACAIGVLWTTEAQASEQRIRGTVQQHAYNRVHVKTSAGQVYDAEVSNAILQRKNGLPMRYEEVAVGDVVDLTGVVWPDLSMTVSRLRNTSLYPHSGTFVGKVLSVDLQAATIMFQSSAYGAQSAVVGPGTSVQVKNAAPLLQNVVPGMTLTVKGTWERTRAVVSARTVQATYRLLNVTIVGSVVSQVGTDITVVAGGAIYAVHTSGVTVQGLPSGQPLSWLLGRQVRVEAKHIAESLELTPTRIRVVTQ